jgi:signal transduction histidine kinase
VNAIGLRDLQPAPVHDAASPDGHLDVLTEALETMVSRFAVVNSRNRELAVEVQQLRAERRRLERDLHDGVQNDLVSLMLKLQLAEEDRDTPAALVSKLSALGDCAEAALDSVREIARGTYRTRLADVGVVEALRAQTARGSIDVSFVGTAARSTEEAEAAMYFSCLEAIQNVAKHAGGGAAATLRLRDEHGALTVRIEDDGCGFDPAHTPAGAGLRNIRHRIEAFGGSVCLESSPGRGTVLTISLRWPRRRRRRAPSRATLGVV